MILDDKPDVPLFIEKIGIFSEQIFQRVVLAVHVLIEHGRIDKFVQNENPERSRIR